MRANIIDRSSKFPLPAFLNKQLHPIIFFTFLTENTCDLGIKEMENLIKQRRVRFSGVGEDSKEGTDSIREGRTPSQQRESFQGDKKAHNSFERQISSQMSPDYESYGSEFATAVAAAAFVIHSAEEARSEYQKRLRDGVEASMSRARTRREEPFRPPESSAVSRLFSGKEARDAGEASMRKRMEPGSRTRNQSFTGRVFGDQSHKETSTRSRSQEAKADAWEKVAMEKIRKRYEKMSSTIIAWENEKKMKAKLQMERKKRELELRRELNSQHYQNKLARINHVSGGARVQMEEKRRNEESEVKERAKRIRSSGKVPLSCFCF